MSKEKHRLIFEKFCRERYVDKSRRTSKTASEEKAKRIRQAVKREASFRHWVNRTKKFELINCAELELTDVLCLPVKAKVSKSRKIHLRACHAGRAAAIYRDMRYVAIFFIHRDMRYIAIFF